MHKNLLILSGLVSLLVVNAWCTTIINGESTPSLVIVSYAEDGCKTNSKELKSGESLYVNQTCQRDKIEKVDSSGYSKIIVTGGYNTDGEIITLQHNQEL